MSFEERGDSPAASRGPVVVFAKDGAFDGMDRRKHTPQKQPPRGAAAAAAAARGGAGA